MQGREIVRTYKGNDFAADEQAFRQQLSDIETRHLPYFINLPGIFEDDPHERLTDHFFFVKPDDRVILLQAESSDLPPEIADEVQKAFTDVFI